MVEKHDQRKLLNELSLKDLKKMVEQKEREEKDKLAERGLAIKQEVEAYVQKKYGLTLQQIFTASSKPAKRPLLYVNPETQEMFWYRHRGRLPDWVKKLNVMPQEPDNEGGKKKPK